MKGLRLLALVALAAVPLLASAQGNKPNVLVIWATTSAHGTSATTTAG